MHHKDARRAFTLIELLVVIAIIAILAVVVVLTLNPAELLRQSRDANRVSDLATLTSALNLYVTDQTGTASFNLGVASDTYPSVYDPTAGAGGNQCQGIGMLSLNTSTGQTWQCAASTTSRNVSGSGWIPINLSTISAGSPIGALPVDPTNQTSTGLFYTYNTNGSQFEVTANLESSKYKSQYGQSPQTNYFPEVITGGNPTISALYNPTGLVAYWPLNDGSGSSTIDQSGNGSTATWTGTAAGNNGTYYVGGKVGNYAGFFNGSNDYANTAGAPASLPVGAAARTLSAWVNLTTYGSGSTRAVMAYGANATNQLAGIEMQSATGKLISDGYVSDCTSNTVVPLNQWSFVAVTYDGLSDRVYFNGALVMTCSNTVRNTASTAVYIGARIGALGNIFNGSIDDVRIYSRTLSQAEVMALYTAEK